jgi:RNA-directed DNA polymerase
LAAEGYRSIRYADDLVVLCRTRAEAEAVLGKLREWMTSRGLTLHPQKTSIVNATQAGGFDFLGYHFERGLRWPRKKSEQELRVKVRAKTRRKTSGSMDTIVETLNPMLRGWWEYFKQSHWTTWEPLDGWIRMRLRSILRWRAKQVGRGRGSDHVRWPNAYFTEHGLFTMAGAHRQAVRTLAGHSR